MIADPLIRDPRFLVDIGSLIPHIGSLVKSADLLPQPRRQPVGLTKGIARGIDRFSDDQAYRTRTKVHGVDGQELIGADESHRDQRRLRANGEKRGSLEKGLELSVWGAAAFRKDEERHPRAQGTQRPVKPAGPLLIDRNLAGAVEMPADERPFPQTLLGQDRN